MTCVLTVWACTGCARDTTYAIKHSNLSEVHAVLSGFIILSSETNGWHREIIGVDGMSGSNPATNLKGHYARSEAIVALSCWPALKLLGSFLVAYTKVKISRVSGRASA